MDSSNRLSSFLHHNKIPLAIGLIGIVLLLGGIVSSGIIGKTFQAQSYPSTSTKPTPALKVDISGAVNHPGVYSLQAGSRVEEVIKVAGGFSDQANPEFVHKTLNRAQKVTDGMKLYIPSKDDKGASIGSGAGVSTSTSGPINTASDSELDKLSGIGMSTAQKIIDKRPYNTLEELMSKKVISKSIFEKIKEKISL